MSETLEISRLRPIGTKVLIKRKPVDEKSGRFIIPEEYRDRNDLKGQLFCGVVIAVGSKTKSAKYGSDRGWFDPGHTVWWYGLYDWADHAIVIKDDMTGDEYMVIEEDSIKAYDLPEESNVIISQR